MIGKKIGNYKIVAPLTKAGGMGQIFVARHRRGRNEVVIKCLRPEMAASSEMRRRFMFEGEVAAEIKHPGVIEVYDYGRLPDGTDYIIMEKLGRETLGHRLKSRGALPVQETLRLMRQLAETLAFVHAAGIVHRDLKPANLIIEPDSAVPGKERIKVLDFGIAKLLRSTDRWAKDLTSCGKTLGTPPYMSVEQWIDSSQVDIRTDLYALGCIMYECLGGRRPFRPRGKNLDTLQMLRQYRDGHLYQTPPLLSSPHGPIPVYVEHIVMRLLEKDPDARFQSCEELVDAIDRELLDESLPATIEFDRGVRPTLDESRADAIPESRDSIPSITQPDDSVSSLVHVRGRRPRARWLGLAAIVALVVAASLVVVVGLEHEIRRAVTHTRDAYRLATSASQPQIETWSIQEIHPPRLMVDTLLEAARERYDDGSYAEALSLCRAVLHVAPDNQSALSVCSLAACKGQDASVANYVIELDDAGQRERARRICADEGLVLIFDTDDALPSPEPPVDEEFIMHPVAAHDDATISAGRFRARHRRVTRMVDELLATSQADGRTRGIRDELARLDDGRWLEDPAHRTRAYDELGQLKRRVRRLSRTRSRTGQPQR